MDNIVEAINNAWKSIKKFFNNLWIKVKKALFKIYSRNTEFRKLYSCYSKTKKKRVRNKYYNRMVNFIVNNPIRI